MNKWEDFKKNEQDCYCSSIRGLFIPNRHLSFIVAGLLFLSFFLFMTGYFLGKKTMAAHFSDKIQQEACADQIYTSVLIADNHEPIIQASNIVCSLDNCSPLGNDKNKIESSVELCNSIDQTLVSLEHTGDNNINCYAELIGFLTEKAAQVFVKKLAAKGIETEIKKRVSKTVKGRTSYWYQVVTTIYSNKNDLVALVNKIIKEEHIKDVNIRHC